MAGVIMYLGSVGVFGAIGLLKSYVRSNTGKEE